MNALNNRGRLINFISGIQGVSPGGQAILNLPVNMRYHRLIFYCADGGVATDTMIDTVRVFVNGISMIDLTPAQIRSIAIANGYTPATGELPLFFTPSWRNVNNFNEVNSWDLFGQSTFQVQLSINAAAVAPAVTGVQEFDYIRNQRPADNGKGLLPFLQPIAQHSFAYNAVSGRNDINNLPFAYPISRIWLTGKAGGPPPVNVITQVEVYQDNNKILEATLADINRSLAPYGIVPAAAGSVFDSAFISDPDQRHWKALKCANSLMLRVTTSAACTLTAVMETLPGAYQS